MKPFKVLFSLFFLGICPINSIGAQLEGFKAKKFESPTREFSVIATDSGYFPDRLFAYVGERARFFVTSTGEKPQCFLIKDHQVFLAAEKGKMSEAQVTFKYPGRFEFYCPSTKFKGHITVLESPDAKKSAGRKIASEKTYWTPRDRD